MLSLKNVSIINKKTNQSFLNNVSLEVKPGDFILVSGQNSTEREVLVSVLGALETIDSGEVYIDGIEQTKYTTSQMVSLRREKFGYMLRDCLVDENLSTSENIAMPLIFSDVDTKIKNEKLERALNIVGLANFKNVLVKNLTEWQKNKILIARAIVNLPAVVIFSEPCRVQDKFRMEEVVSLLSALNKDGVTVIVNSNCEEYISVTKRRIVITNGSILELKKERISRQPETKKIKRTSKLKPEKVKKDKEEKSKNSIAVSRADTQKEAELVKIVAEKELPVKKNSRKKVISDNAEQLNFEKQEAGEEPAKKRGRKKQGVESDANAK